MNPDRQDPPSSLDAALDALPRSIEPGRDLWPAIEARLESREVRGGRRWLWPAAAAVLLVVGSSLITATLLRDDEPLVARRAPADRALSYAAASFGPGQALGPAYEVARQDLTRTLSARIDRLPPDARRQVEKNLAEIRRASAEINAALELSPGDPLLEELLLNAYQDELAVLASVNQLAGGNGAGPIDATRMQL
jgi:uncharacterized membrane protein YdfJ with MMPL/SSD domain